MDFRILVWGFTALFVYLKLVGHVDWSWWLVLSPLIAGYFILLIFTIRLVALAKARELGK